LLFTIRDACSQRSLIIVQLACYFTICIYRASPLLSPVPLTYGSQPSFARPTKPRSLDHSMHLLPANPWPIRIARNLQLPQSIKTRPLPPNTSNIQIMRPPSREPTFPLPSALHILPLLTLRLAVQHPHFLEINIGGVKGRALPSLLGTFAFEECGQVARLDLLVAGKHGC